MGGAWPPTRLRLRTVAARGGSGISAACEVVLESVLHVRRSWRRKSSLFGRMFFQGDFSTAGSILFQENPLSGMLFQSRINPDSEESSLRDAFPQQKAS